MLTLTAVLLGLIAVAMWRATRSTLSPAVLYCGVWSATLGGLVVAGAIFLPVSEYACLIYLVGAVSFTFGSIFCLSCLGAGAIEGPRRPSPPAARVTLDLLLALLILLFPYFLHLAIAIAGTSNPIVMVQYIRQLSVQSEEGSPYGPVANLTVLAPLVALLMTYEMDGSFSRRARAVLAVVLALAYSILTGSKGGAFILLTAFFVVQVKARRIKVRTAITVGALFMAFFAAGLLAINLGGQTRGGKQVVEQEVGGRVLNYWLGAPVAYSSIAQKPDALPSSESIDRFFLQTGNSLGMKNSIPSINPPYTPIEVNGANSNTYTIYFSYFKDFGWLGAILLPAAIGAMLTWLWRRAMTGGALSVMLYASFCTGILQSIYSENFFLTLNFYIKAVVFYVIAYRVCPALYATLHLRASRAADDREFA